MHATMVIADNNQVINPEITQCNRKLHEEYQPSKTADLSKKFSEDMAHFLDHTITPTINGQTNELVCVQTQGHAGESETGAEGGYSKRTRLT